MIPRILVFLTLCAGEDSLVISSRFALLFREVIAHERHSETRLNDQFWGMIEEGAALK